MIVMNKNFNLKIITPDKEFFNGDIISLNCETTDGRRGILPNHCPMIAGLVGAITRFKGVDDKEYEVNTSGGMLKVDNNEVIILCNFAEWVKN